MSAVHPSAAQMAQLVQPAARLAEAVPVLKRWLQDAHQLAPAFEVRKLMGIEPYFLEWAQGPGRPHLVLAASVSRRAPALVVLCLQRLAADQASL